MREDELKEESITYELKVKNKNDLNIRSLKSLFE